MSLSWELGQMCWICCNCLWIISKLPMTKKCPNGLSLLTPTTGQPIWHHILALHCTRISLLFLRRSNKWVERVCEFKRSIDRPSKGNQLIPCVEYKWWKMELNQAIIMAIFQFNHASIQCNFINSRIHHHFFVSTSDCFNRTIGAWFDQLQRFFLFFFFYFYVTD